MEHHIEVIYFNIACLHGCVGGIFKVIRVQFQLSRFLPSRILRSDLYLNCFNLSGVKASYVYMRIYLCQILSLTASFDHILLAPALLLFTAALSFIFLSAPTT
jgi:hypothetical protein